jgi:hypothetical protein
MNRSTGRTHLAVGALAALYLLWLATWFVFGRALYGPTRYCWDQATAAAVTGLVAFHAARQRGAPYRGFLALQGAAFLFLAASWVTYPPSSEPSGATALVQDPGRARQLLLSNAVYALFVFSALCAWGYLTLERWRHRPLSTLTTVVFAVLMLGLGAIFGSVYYNESGWLDDLEGRLDAVTAALEFAVLVTGLFCMLLQLPAPVIWMLVGTVMLIAGSMTFSADILPTMSEVVWMSGQFLLLAAMVAMATGSEEARGEAGRRERSEISGILILVSLGAVLLSPLVWFLPAGTVWKSFFSALFVVALVVVLVWITDRFDDTVTYLRGYVRQMHESRLVAEEWRGAPSRIRAALQSTGLGGFLDEFRDSGARLKHDVLFLGPERLYAPPRDLDGSNPASCFIVMPFGREWSVDVHRILAGACQAAGVRPVRGDDLFTPTDILEDIWQSINAADFVIADITGRNPNVLYELGIAHTLAKPVMIISRDAADIPIDLATRRVILYGQAAGDWREDLASRIAQAVAGIVGDYGLAVRQGP